MKLIKLNVLAQNSISDTTMYLKIETIVSVSEASAHDRGVRENLNSLITTDYGNTYACTNTVESVIEEMNTYAH